MTSSAETPASDPTHPVSDGSFRQAEWKLRDLIVAVTVLVLWRSLPILLKPDWFRHTAGQLLLILVWLTLLGWLLAYPFWVLRKRSRRVRVRYPGTLKLLGEAAISIPITIGVIVIVGTADYFWWRLGGQGPAMPEVVEDLVWSRNMVIVFSFVIASITVGPIVEETFFRGFLYNVLRTRCGPVIAAIAQSFLFAIIHHYGWYHSALVFILGLLLVLVYEWRRTIVSPILVHAGLNLVTAISILALTAAAANTPVLGVRGVDCDEGCMITEVGPGTAAEGAGLQVGDIIDGFGDYRIETFEQLVWAVREREIGGRVTIVFMRGGERLEQEVVLGRSP